MDFDFHDSISAKGEAGRKVELTSVNKQAQHEGARRSLSSKLDLNSGLKMPGAGFKQVRFAT